MQASLFLVLLLLLPHLVAGRASFLRQEPAGQPWVIFTIFETGSSSCEGSKPALINAMPADNTCLSGGMTACCCCCCRDIALMCP